MFVYKRRRAAWELGCAPKYLAPCVALVVCAVAACRARGQETVLASVASPEPEPSAEVIPWCKTDVRLSGAVYNARHPERSFALVQVRKNEHAGLVRVGSSLGAFRILAIEPRGILLRSTDGQCWLRLVGDPTARATNAPPARRAKLNKQAARHKESGVVVIGRR